MILLYLKVTSFKALIQATLRCCPLGTSLIFPDTDVTSCQKEKNCGVKCFTNHFENTSFFFSCKCQINNKVSKFTLKNSNSL